MMRRAARLLMALGLFALVAGSFSTRIALAADVETFADEFDHAGYGGNDGSRPWTGPWKESPTNNGSSKGRITVETRLDECSDGCLSIGEPGLEPDLEIERSADTQGADRATLRVEYLIDGGMEIEGRVRLEVSDGGSQWETLQVFFLSESETEMTVAEFDVTDHIGPATTVRFSIEGVVLASAALLVDELTLIAEFPEEVEPTTTTTTTPPSATTTAPSTTTRPSTTTTTTTTRPSVTTTTTSTTQPPTTSSTTAAGSEGPASTTTSIPRPTDDPAYATDKGALVSSSESAAEAVMQPIQDPAPRNEPEPLHVVTFVNAAESVRSTAVYGVGIGLLLAGFLLLGFEVPEEDGPEGPETKVR